MPRPIVTPRGTKAGAKLKDAREAAGLTRTELARMIAKSYQSVVSIEGGRGFVSLEMIWTVAEAIGCNPHSIDPRLASRAPRPPGSRSRALEDSARPG